VSRAIGKAHPVHRRTAPEMIAHLAIFVAGFSAVGSPRHGLLAAGHRRSPLVTAAQSAGVGGGMMKDGARIGPPPDMPSLLLNNRIVYLGMPINAQVTELIISELLFLQYDASEKPILMYINSPGTSTETGLPVGFETEAFAIADTMAYVQPPIHTVCIGKAYGLAAMLLASGEKGQRSALPYTTVMLHQPRGQQASGQASDIAIKAQEVLLNRKVALDIMSKHTGQTYDKLAADTNRCLYLDAQQAVDYGIVDKIITKTISGDPRQESLASVSRGIG